MVAIHKTTITSESLGQLDVVLHGEVVQVSKGDSLVAEGYWDADGLSDFFGVGSYDDMFSYRPALLRTLESEVERVLWTVRLEAEKAEALEEMTIERFCELHELPSGHSKSKVAVLLRSLASGLEFVFGRPLDSDEVDDAAELVHDYFKAWNGNKEASD